MGAREWEEFHRLPSLASGRGITAESPVATRTTMEGFDTFSALGSANARRVPSSLANIRRETTRMIVVDHLSRLSPLLMGAVLVLSLACAGESAPADSGEPGMPLASPTPAAAHLPTETPVVATAAANPSTRTPTPQASRTPTRTSVKPSKSTTATTPASSRTQADTSSKFSPTMRPTKTATPSSTTIPTRAPTATPPPTPAASPPPTPRPTLPPVLPPKARQRVELAAAPEQRQAIDVPSLNARVTELRFFEIGFDGVRLDARVYTDAFPRQSTRYVSWELHPVFPPQPERRDFEVQAIFIDLMEKFLADTASSHLWTRAGPPGTLTGAGGGGSVGNGLPAGTGWN